MIKYRKWCEEHFSCELLYERRVKIMNWHVPNLGKLMFFSRFLWCIKAYYLSGSLQGTRPSLYGLACYKFGTLNLYAKIWTNNENSSFCNIATNTFHRNDFMRQLWKIPLIRCKCFPYNLVHFHTIL